MRLVFRHLSVWLLMLGLATASFAQSDKFHGRIRKANNASNKIAGAGFSAQAKSSQPGNSVQTLWDVNLSFDPTDQTGVFGWAGVVYAKGLFFCSKWNGADTLAIFDSTGNFVDILTIPGIGAVRGMTYDGTNIWAANNTRFIQVIDPVTFTKVRQCTVTTAVGSVRWITYNPEGNAGAGSFYCGNYGTALFQVRKPTGVSTNMANINNIAATVHGLTGMYGVAYEANGADSKFWAFDQGQTESAAVIVQLDASGTPTGIRRDVDLDAPAGAGGSAGGIHLADLGGFPGKTLVCLNQGGGVVGYDIKVPGFDAIFDSLATTNGLIAWPKKWTSASKMAGKIRSNGTTTLANFSPSVEVMDAENLTPIQTLQVNSMTIPGGQSQSFETAELVPGFYNTNTLYMAQGTTNFPGDETAANDTAFAFFGMTDSTIVQDYIYFDQGLASPIGIGAPSNENKALGAKFSIPSADTLTSVSYFLSSPFEGQSSSVSIFPVVNGVPSDVALATTTQIYTATADDALNGVAVTLNLDSPLPLAAGEFLVAVNELGDSTCGLGSINFNFKPNTFFVKWASNTSGGAWEDLIGYPGGLQRAFAVYPNFGNLPTNTTVAPVCSTSSVSAITFTSASVSSTVIADGGASVTERGVCWSTSPNPTIALSTKTSDGAGLGEFTSNVSGLTANTTYYLRAYATNAAGTSYGNESFFTTQSSNVLATLSTTTALVTSVNSATSGGNISADGGAPILGRGVCWSTSQDPTISLSTKTFDGTGSGTFTSEITGLTPNTTYYLRAYAQNSVGVAYGDQITFTTIITSVPASSKKSQQAQLALSPNPVQNRLNLNLDNAANGVAQIRILDLSGKETLRLNAEIAEGKTLSAIELGSLAKGTYMLELSLNQQTATSKFIKE